MRGELVTGRAREQVWQLLFKEYWIIPNPGVGLDPKHPFAVTADPGAPSHPLSLRIQHLNVCYYGPWGSGVPVATLPTLVCFLQM